MVAAGLGIALAPRLALTSRRSDVRLLALTADNPPPTRRILLARAASRATTPPADAMARLLRTVAQRFTTADLDRTQLGAVRSAGQGRG